MQIREASRACFNTCCVNLPEEEDPHGSSSPPKSGGVVVAINPRDGFVSAILSSIQPNTGFTNHESLPSLQDLKDMFPCVLADDIRAREYHHLSVMNRVCLDYIGNGLFSYSQLWKTVPLTETASTSSAKFSPTPGNSNFFNVSCNTIHLNSYLKYGVHESEFQTTTRQRITKYMNLFEQDYSVVFTANQPSAFKILAESYPFNNNQTILTVYDYENESVQAMIDTATKQGARAKSAAFSWPNFRVNSRKLRKLIVNKSKPRNRGLFVFPLQSRITGARYSYQWMNLARENGWHVLLDACALGAKDMETLGLSLFQPDFLVCSFFKIFGFNPSGFSCLFVKKSSVSVLSQSSATMGIISIIPAIDETPQCQEIQIINNKQKDSSISEIIEINVKQDVKPESSEKDDENMKSRIEFRGLDHADELGLIRISSRVRCLVNWLVNALLTLRHPHSGFHLIRIYGPRIKLDRGPAIAFNVYDWKAERIDPNLVQKLADRNNISLTCGFLKNVCFSKNSRLEKGKLFEIRNPEEKRKGKLDWGLQVASISIGMLNDFEDVYRVWGFVSRFLDADFVEKERWRYTGIDQSTVEI